MTKFEKGQLAVDMKREAVCVIVDLLATPAKDYQIQALGGRTVAQENQNQSPEDPVVQVVYIESAEYRLSEWSPESLVQDHETDRINDVGGLRVYSLPAGRLKPSRAFPELIEEATTEIKTGT